MAGAAGVGFRASSHRVIETSKHRGSPIAGLRDIRPWGSDVLGSSSSSTLRSLRSSISRSAPPSRTTWSSRGIPAPIATLDRANRTDRSRAAKKLDEFCKDRTSRYPLRETSETDLKNQGQIQREKKALETQGVRGLGEGGSSSFQGGRSATGPMAGLSVRSRRRSDILSPASCRSSQSSCPRAPS
jgi:hypothetical protein